jgi:arylsulfatase A-like enzyme
MNAIVLTFDRLPLSFLAGYGNSWIETPNFDRLASQSATFQQHFCESLTLDTVRHAWWSGCYESRRDRQSPLADLLPTLLAARDVTVRMVLEKGAESDGSADQLSRLFPDCTSIVTGTDGLDVPADDTPFLRTVARALRDLRLLRTSRREPWLLWIKSRGVPTPWLPPAEYASRFLEVDDDEPKAEEPSDDDLAEEEADDADLESEDIDLGVEEDEGTFVEMSPAQFEELLRSAANLPESRAVRDAMQDVDRALMRKVLGGYVSLLDEGLGRLLEAVDQAGGGAPTLLLVTAAQGLTVREPGVLRDAWAPAAEETIHTPLFIRLPGLNQGSRRQALTQSVDIYPTLVEWFGVERPEGPLDGQSLLPAIRGEDSEPRRAAFASDGGDLRAVRTTDFYLVQNSAGDPVNNSAENSGEPARRLFAKPEDAWEVNDLAAQSPQVVDELAAECAEFFGERATS